MTREMLSSYTPADTQKCLCTQRVAKADLITWTKCIRAPASLGAPQLQTALVDKKVSPLPLQNSVQNIKILPNPLAYFMNLPQTQQLPNSLF